MVAGPGLFSDIGKKARDLLTRDYISDQKFSVSTYSDSGVAITSTAVKKGGLSTGDVAAIYKYKNTQIHVKVDTASNISTILTVTDVFPSTKAIASLKLPDYSTGKLEIQYFHHHATFTSAAALNKNPFVDVSATLGTPTISFGAEARYDTTSGVTRETASSYLHHLDQAKRRAVVGEINRKFSTNENTFTVGGSYAIDQLTVVKAKLNNHGKLGALLQHELIPKSVLTVAGDFDTKALDKTPRFGVALSLKP